MLAAFITLLNTKESILLFKYFCHAKYFVFKTPPKPLKDFNEEN
jgi:hypothetical protein